MKDFSKNILGKIKKEKIKPISKWNFIFKRSFIWSLFGVSIILGGFAFGSILAQISNTEWDIHTRVSDSFASFVFMTLPYLWIVFMLGFSALAYYYLRHTSKGYRYNTVILINSSLLISVLFGSSLYATGISHKIENTFQEKIPFYREVLDPRARHWKNPEKGLLAGKVLEIVNDEEIKIMDIKKQIWNVDISDAIVEKEIPLKENIRLKIIGQKDKEFYFIANEILFWGMPKENMCKPNGSKEPCIRPPKEFQKNMKENLKPMRTTN